jgi:DNA-binding transcriptional LysR family regulator
VALDWDDVRFFLAVVREPRLVTAGRALRVRHTTVARRLAALEKSLGTRLFHRTARGHLLTDAGREILPVAEEIERATLALGRRARPAKGAPTGRVRVAIVESWAVEWLAPRLPELHRRHPQLSLEVVAQQGPSDLSRGEAEIAVRIPRPTQKELAAVKLGTGSTGLYATRALADRYRAQIERDPPDGRGVPLLCWDPHRDFLQSAAWFRDFRAVADVRLTTNSTLALLSAARAGLGVCTTARFCVRGDDLVPLGPDLSRHDLWLVSHPDFRDEPRVRAVMDWLREVGPTIDDPRPSSAPRPRPAPTS